MSSLLGTTASVAHESLERQLVELSEAIAAHPRDADLYLRRGEARRVHRQWAAAEADYARSRKLEPGSALVDFCRGAMNLEAGRPAKALSALERYLAARPGDARGLAARARAHARLGAHRDAAADYSRSIAAYLKDGVPPPEIYVERARELSDPAAQRADRRAEALGGLEEGLAVLGRPIALEIEALDLELALGRLEAALARTERLATTYPDSVSWRMRRAEILEKARGQVEARGAYAAVRDAIAALPSARRRIPALLRIDAEARSACERLGDAGARQD